MDFSDWWLRHLLWYHSNMNVNGLHLWSVSIGSGNFELSFRYVIFKRISVTDGWGISCDIALMWTSIDFTYDQLILVQVMAWCRQATSHYLSQCGLDLCRHMASLGHNELRELGSVNRINLPGGCFSRVKIITAKLILSQNTHNRCPIAPPWRTGMGCFCEFKI